MDNNGIIGELLESGQSIAKKAGNQVVKTAQMAGSQVTGKPAGGQSGQSHAHAPAPDAAKAPPMDFAKDFLQIEQNPGSQPKQQQTQQPQPQKQTNPMMQQLFGNQQKSPEEMAQIDATRKRLQMIQHKQNYFEPTFNPQKPQEERPADKIERQKQEELMELQQKEQKKAPDIALSRAQRSAEMNRGASG